MSYPEEKVTGTGSPYLNWTCRKCFALVPNGVQHYCKGDNPTPAPPSEDGFDLVGFRSGVPIQPQAPTPDAERCTVPPQGWQCTRKPGHDGPCAAIPDAEPYPHLDDMRQCMIETANENAALRAKLASEADLKALADSIGHRSCEAKLAESKREGFEPAGQDCGNCGDVYEDGYQAGLTEAARVANDALSSPAAPDGLRGAAEAMIAYHDAIAKAANFERCGCADCKPFRLALGKE